MRVRGDCQNTTSRPRARVNTICERCSRPRSQITSIAAPRRVHARNATRSTMSGASGHSSAPTGWQYNALVRGHVPLVRNTSPPSRGSQRRNGSELSASGLRAIRSSTPRSLTNDQAFRVGRPSVRLREWSRGRFARRFRSLQARVGEPAGEPSGPVTQRAAQKRPLRAVFSGGPGGGRTHAPRIMSPLLYR